MKIRNNIRICSIFSHIFVTLQYLIMKVTNMKRLFILFAVCCIIIISIFTYQYFRDRNTLSGHRVVLCIPVYGQSLALGEEAVRITDFDSIRIKYDGRIVNENLNYKYGSYSNKKWKRILKRFLQDHRRSFELSLYSMAEVLAKELGKDTIICIFPGGMGETPIFKLVKEYNNLYPIFISDIKNAYEIACCRGWDFYVPAICWMQGESDIADYTKENYQVALKHICTDMNKDIKSITHQKDDIHFICYQPNILTLAEKFDDGHYDCIETRVSQAIVDLIRDDTLFWASGPTYPCNFVNDRLHIDAIGQQQIGRLEANAALNIIRKGSKTYGLIPKSISVEGNDVVIQMQVPQPPLVIDTIAVKPIDHYGFSVITKGNKNIIKDISIEDSNIRLHCTQSPDSCKIRYAVNGEKRKSGNRFGPRGNLRDSHPLQHWCYQFDMLCNP